MANHSEFPDEFEDPEVEITAAKTREDIQRRLSYGLPFERDKSPPIGYRESDTGAYSGLKETEFVDRAKAFNQCFFQLGWHCAPVWAHHRGSAGDGQGCADQCTEEYPGEPDLAQDLTLLGRMVTKINAEAMGQYGKDLCCGDLHRALTHGTDHGNTQCQKHRGNHPMMA